MKLPIDRYFFISKSIFEFLQKNEIDFLKKHSHQKVHKKNSDIFFEGSYPKGVYILEKGKVKIFQNTLEGNEHIITIHTDGEIFGYRPLLCDEKYPVSAKAIDDCKVTFIPKKYFLQVLRQSATLSNFLLGNLSYEFTVWVNTITNLAQRSVKERLLLNILILVEKYRNRKKWPVDITISRSDLAALTGTSHETLARMVKRIRQEKIVTVKGRTITVTQGQADKIAGQLYF